MKVTLQIKEINKKLVEIYGKDISVSQPNWRVVWTDDQYETRFNAAGFDIYAENDVFLRTEFGPHTVEKYPLQQEMWVLERLLDSIKQDDISLIGADKYSYEPVWFFGLGDSNRRPIWRAVDLLVKATLYARSKEVDSPAELDRKEEAKMAKEKLVFKDMIQDASPYLVGALLDGAAVSKPNKEFVPEVVGDKND